VLYSTNTNAPQIHALNPKVVSSNLTPATIFKTCLSTGLRDEQRANWCQTFIAQFAQLKSQPSFLAPFATAHPQFDQVLRYACLAKYRKAKAPKGVESTSIPCPVQRFE
jgi:hypothetical protein